MIDLASSPPTRTPRSRRCSTCRWHRQGPDAARAGEARLLPEKGGGVSTEDRSRRPEGRRLSPQRRPEEARVTLRDHAEDEEAVGAYLLDALPDLEAEVFERHMLRCRPAASRSSTCGLRSTRCRARSRRCRCRRDSSHGSCARSARIPAPSAWLASCPPAGNGAGDGLGGGRACAVVVGLAVFGATQLGGDAERAPSRRRSMPSAFSGGTGARRGPPTTATPAILRVSGMSSWAAPSLPGGCGAGRASVRSRRGVSTAPARRRGLPPRHAPLHGRHGHAPSGGRGERRRLSRP